MHFEIKLENYVKILNWLFLLFPLTFIAGNSIINAHFLLFIILGIFYLIKKKINIKFDLLIFLFFLFCITLIISTLVNDFNVTKSLFFLRFLVFFLICSYLLNEKLFSVEKVYNFFAIIVFIICIDLVFQNIFGHNIFGFNIQNFGTIKHSVATSFFFDEQIAGSFVQSFGFFLVYFIFNKFKKKNFINLFINSILLALISYSIFISFQRVPMMIWTLFLIIYSIIYFKSRIMPVILSFLILAVLINNFSSKEIRESYVSFFNNVKNVSYKTVTNYKIIKDKKIYDQIRTDPVKAEKFESGSGHASLFANALYIWEDNKLIGIGYKNFYNKCVEKKLTRCSTHPHNFYLDILVSTGLVGLLIIVFYVLNFFRTTVIIFLKNRKENSSEKNDILIVAFLNFLMHFFPFKSSGSFFTTSSATYMMIIIVILFSLIKKLNLSEEKN